MIVSDQLLAHRSQFLELERAAAAAYSHFVYHDEQEANTIRERLFDEGVCEFAAPFSRILLSGNRAAGMVSCLSATQLARCRMRSAFFLARSGLLQDRPATRARMEMAGRTLMRLEPSDFYLSRIAVSAGEAGSGAADQLMRYCEECARAAGSTRIALEVESGNDRALAFYRKKGFSKIDQRATRDPQSGRTLEYLHLAKSLG
ncbi:MAG: GNAT family N-acetyltransferase [Sphingomicrobium sp.]|nr:GNAT family N-acetyltransferase [Sphingomonadales bacterium]